MKYVYLRDREEFLKNLYSSDSSELIDTCYLCERDHFDRIIGASVILTRDVYLEHLDLIDSGLVKRNDSIRRISDVPEFDKVKNLKLTIDGKDYYLYHRTHLIPFRFCLDDGNLRNLLFTATARLNSGLRIEERYIPEKFQIDDNVEKILNKIEIDAKYFEDFDSTNLPSLADFERAASCILFRDKDHHIFKYSVECIYDTDDCRLASLIRVTMKNVILDRLVFSARLKNVL